jgi:NADPH-dependent glutamate synthase beta subunit-like oxidoreductase
MTQAEYKIPACPVNDTIGELRTIIDEGKLPHPKTRRIAEEILELLEDIAWGRAGNKHLPAVENLANELYTVKDAGVGSETADFILSSVREHAETFLSHVTTHNCFSGACIKLAPAPCQTACPAGIDVPTYVTLIGNGHYEEAISIIRKDNPFPWVCGLVCTRPCEFMCVRGRIDQPVSIKFLKAFAAEKAMSQGRYVNPAKAEDNGKKVCVIGAGPGGMTCAYYLALKGYAVTIIESLPFAGGMVMVGIPRYRLPREVIDREVAMLEELGVAFRFNTSFGGEITLESLREEGFESFFFAIGAHHSYKLNIPGETEYGVVEAIDLLRQVALGERRKPGKKVIVIGGGNVAIDAARTCLRLGADDVSIAYRRTRSEMPADEEEVEQAEEEGIRMAYLTVPEAVIGRDGQTLGLKCLRAKMAAKDGSDRMVPVPIDGSRFIMDADVVISAIGQQVDRECLEGVPDLQWTRRNTIDVNTISMETNVSGVFAAGDAVTGPATVIEAIGGGKRAADAIDRYLNGIPQPNMPPVPVRRGRVSHLCADATEKMILKRPEMPLLRTDRRRTTFQQVEMGYSEEEARKEALRCLRCDICRRCGRCVEVCRDRMKVDALQMGYFDFDRPGDTDLRLTKERCILCGACATNCPNGALKIADFNGERILTLCGTELNRQEIQTCASCGTPVGTRRYLNYIHHRIRPDEDIRVDNFMCDVCLRKKTAAVNID